MLKNQIIGTLESYPQLQQKLIDSPKVTTAKTIKTATVGQEERV